MFQQINDSFKQGTQECKTIMPHVNNCSVGSQLPLSLDTPVSVFPTESGFICGGEVVTEYFPFELDE